MAGPIHLIALKKSYSHPSLPHHNIEFDHRIKLLIITTSSTQLLFISTHATFFKSKARDRSLSCCVTIPPKTVQNGQYVPHPFPSLAITNPAPHLTIEKTCRNDDLSAVVFIPCRVIINFPAATAYCI